MKLKWLLVLSAVFVAQGFAQERIAEEERSVKERIEFLEDKRAYHFKKKRYKIIARGELLYWKASVDGVATETTSITRDAAGTTGEVATHIKTRSPHFSYDPGFRIGAGLESPFDLFDFYVVWTRFFSTGSDKAHGTRVTGDPSSGDKVINGNIGVIKDLISVPNMAKANCAIQEDLIDLQIARGIEASPNFFMRPYFGIRGVLSDIDWDIRAKRNFITPSALDQDSSRLKVKNGFNAVGGLIGLNLDWQMPMGFGIRVQGSGALVWGRNKERTQQQYVFVPAGTAAQERHNYNARNSFYTLKAMWEFFIGGYWERSFPSRQDLGSNVVSERKKQQTTIRLLAGFEFQQWPYFGQKTNVQETRERERFSVGFHGFTGGIGLLF